MRATDFIRGLLDLIDNVQTEQDPTTDYEEENMEYGCGCGPDCDCPECIETAGFSNSPGEQVTTSDTLLSMGNDINKPKNPADIRVSTVALYPDTAYKGN
jgi:hypothetical protein